MPTRRQFLVSTAASAVASGQILKRLHRLARDEDDDSTSDNLLKFASTTAILLKGEQNNERLKIAHERLLQHHMALRLKKDKQQRDAVAIRVLGEARAKAIEAAPWSHAEKIEGVGIPLFGPLWEPRPVPTPGSPPQSAANHLKSL